jgi:hypothetical protein
MTPAQREQLPLLPALPSDDFFKAAQHTIRSADGRALLTYDPATQSGFVYQIATGHWHICAQISFTLFTFFATGIGYAPADDESLAHWLRACLTLPAPACVDDDEPASTTKH